MRAAVVTMWVALAACKIVHSTPGDPLPDAEPGRAELRVGFLQDELRVYEGDGSGQVVVVTSGTADRDVTLHIHATEQSALLGVDFQFEDTTRVIPLGMQYAYVPVTILPDTLEEGDETFLLEITDAVGATLERTQMHVTISANQRPTVNFETAAQSVSELTSGPVALTLSERSSVPVRVSYTVGGTATAADYTLSSTIATFAPGQTRLQLPFSTINDAIDEPDETVVVTLTQAMDGVLGTRSTHTYTIRDDDPQPIVYIATGSSIGESATKATVTVNISAASSYPITVPFTVASSSTATAGSDYVVMTQSPLLFPPGTTAASITVQILDDSEVEGWEEADIQLLPPTNAILGGSQSQPLYILDDDCLGSGTFTACPTQPRLGDTVLPPEIDTDSACGNTYLAGWSPNGQPDACVIFARSITVGTTWVHGSRPLVLVAPGAITIDGMLDVSSHVGYAAPGGPGAPCTVLPGVPSRTGGAGGSFMTVGGAGGSHNNPDGAGGAPAAALAAAPSYLRGGCRGQIGGDVSGSPAGEGGGAVYLVSGSSITVKPNAVIDASGGYGASSIGASAGGSGGGTGGMIVLDASSITATGAFIVANGGGGAEGNTSTATGSSGGKPNPLTPFVSAVGGSGTQGGDGGRGFAQGSPAGNGSSANNNNGGGGGGGGAGYIHSSKPLTGATVSPTAQ